MLWSPTQGCKGYNDIYLLLLLLFYFFIFYLFFVAKVGHRFTALEFGQVNYEQLQELTDNIVLLSNRPAIPLS